MPVKKRNTHSERNRWTIDWKPSVCEVQSTVHFLLSPFSDSRQLKNLWKDKLGNWRTPCSYMALLCSQTVQPEFIAQYTFLLIIFSWLENDRFQLFMGWFYYILIFFFFTLRFIAVDCEDLSFTTGLYDDFSRCWICVMFYCAVNTSNNGARQNHRMGKLVWILKVYTFIMAKDV